MNNKTSYQRGNFFHNQCDSFSIHGKKYQGKMKNQEQEIKKGKKNSNLKQVEVS